MLATERVHGTTKELLTVTTSRARCNNLIETAPQTKTFAKTTGKTQEWRSPGDPDSEPYGIAATPDGTVWYVETGLTPNRIIGFNPKTQPSQLQTPFRPAEA